MYAMSAGKFVVVERYRGKEMSKCHRLTGHLKQFLLEQSCALHSDGSGILCKLRMRGYLHQAGWPSVIMRMSKLRLQNKNRLYIHRFV